MKIRTLLPVFGTLLIFTTAAIAQEPAPGPNPAEVQANALTHKAPAEGLVVSPAVANPQTAVGTSVCFTCGGDWPVFSGYIPTSAAADERGSGCSGDFSTSANDHTPYICTR